MGIFTRQPKGLVYDEAKSRRNMGKMRELFNDAVEDGDSYAILHATETTSKFERGFVLNTTTTTFYHYIVGYRRGDWSVVLVEINREMNFHSSALAIEMDQVVGATYDRKYHQACLHYRKGYGSYGEILDIGDTGVKTMYGIPNTVQREEREAFLDFLEALRAKLEQEGHKQEKWKR